MDNTSAGNGQTKDLFSYIQNGGYQTVNVDPGFVDQGGETLAEVLNPNGLGSADQPIEANPSGQATSADTENATASAGQPGDQSGVTTQPDANFVAEQNRLAAERASFEQERTEYQQTIARQAAEQRQQEAQMAARREEQQFAQQLGQVEDPNERRAMIAEFQRDRAVRFAQTAQQTVAQQQAIDAGNREAAAKNAVVFAVARQNGIPNEFVPFLSKASSPAELDQMIGQAKTFLSTQQQANVQQQRTERVESGIDVASGTNAGFVPPAAPKERSGDVLGLIRSTQHKLMQVGIE